MRSNASKSNRRQFFGTLGGLSAASLAASGTQSRGRPNVLLLLVDQWSALCLTGTGNVLRTPAIDSLAANGTLFRNSYCTFPLCSPSRSSLFTGRMPHETGVMANVPVVSGIVPGSMPVLGELFAKAGYATGYFGKEHVGGAACRGFQTLGSIQYSRGGYIADGSVLDPLFVRDAIEFIKTRRQSPFLAVVSLINPHDICYTLRTPSMSIVDACTAFEERPGKYLRGQDFPPLLPNFRPAPPASMGRVSRNQASWTEKEWRLYLATYYLLIENTDWLLSRVLASLQEAGLEKDTLVLFTADHGDQMGAHQLVAKSVFYREAAQVPFVVSWKGVTKPGQVNDKSLVSGVDVLPTLCDYAGIRAPEGIPGRSVRPLMERNLAPWREYLVSETYEGRMLVVGAHKYIRYKRDEPAEFLFDLQRDPGETRDLSGEPGSKSTLKNCRELLTAWMKETGGAFADLPAAEMRKRLRDSGSMFR